MLESEPAIVIDGPAAVGKSTVGEMLAQRMGRPFVDTGVMYRAVAAVVVEGGIDIDDEDAVTEMARSMAIQVDGGSGPESRRVIVDGQDVTGKIRTQAVDRKVSVVSRYGGVRDAMVAQQRKMASGVGVVMVGRDIGTVVLPDAKLKIYLTASLKVRAQRRQAELETKGSDVSFEATMEDMERRDRIDSEREHSPMKPAPDAILLDTSGLSAEQIVNRILELWHSVN